MLTSSVVASSIAGYFSLRASEISSKTSTILAQIENQQDYAQIRFVNLYEGYREIIEITREPLLTDAELTQVQNGEDVDLEPIMERFRKQSRGIEIQYQKIRPLFDEEYRISIERLSDDKDSLLLSELEIGKPLKLPNKLELFRLQNKINLTTRHSIVSQMDKLRLLNPIMLAEE